MNDEALLRQYEPILAFTRGELFLPSAVDPYLATASLWTQPPRALPIELIAPGGLDVDSLAAAGNEHQEDFLFVRLVLEPLGGLDLQRWGSRPDRPRFRAPGRLARVGLLARLIDAAFTASLWLRGRVPSGTTAVADQRYRAMTPSGTPPVYYGHVVREGGYIVLHYLFFYFMNDYRSSFNGANDHEADWEQAMVVLDANGGATPAPVWVAASSHDFTGDDLRRRWDDPELIREGDHPVLFAGAGSHAHYFQPGEFVHQVEIRALRPLRIAWQQTQRFWRDVLRQGNQAEQPGEQPAGIGVPFIDYARGDGPHVGPGYAAWRPIVIDDSTPWVSQYRGLWGLDTRDWFAGERAPSGPRYNRDGSERRSWHDPLGWTGLDTVAPPSQAPALLASRIADLTEAAEAEEGSIQEERLRLRRRELDLEAANQAAYLGTARRRWASEQAAATSELRRRQDGLSERWATREALIAEQTRLAAGGSGSPRAHIHHVPVAMTEGERRRGRLVEIWSAISVGVLLLGSASLFFVGGDLRWGVVGALMLGFVLIEAFTRRRFVQLLLNLTILLSIASAAALFWLYWPLIVGLGILVAAVIIVRDNVRELRSD